MRHPHALSAPLVLAIALLLAGPVDARSTGQAADTGAPATGHASKADDLTTGTIEPTPAEKRKKQFEDCMAIWDPATHMTKKQWRRTCTNTFDELPNL